MVMFMPCVLYVLGTDHLDSGGGGGGGGVILVRPSFFSSAGKPGYFF